MDESKNILKKYLDDHIGEFRDLSRKNHEILIRDRDWNAEKARTMLDAKYDVTEKFIMQLHDDLKGESIDMIFPIIEEMSIWTMRLIFKDEKFQIVANLNDNIDCLVRFSAASEDGKILFHGVMKQRDFINVYRIFSKMMR